ncbi:MAG: DUF805 domain-containing protein [Paludibacteraceae bacterium]|nr:DUF805 domain-containing protein [Paludibacteraceae bacterium]
MDNENQIVKNESTELSEVNREKVLLDPEEMERREKRISDMESTFELKSNKRPMFSAPFSFDGRIRRMEYGLTMLILYAISMAVGFILGLVLVACGAGDAVDSQGTTLLFYILMIPAFWFHIAQGAKRCHDRGNSGWYQIIPFYALILIFGEGEKGPNRYGENPKGE